MIAIMLGKMLRQCDEFSFPIEYRESISEKDVSLGQYNEDQ